VLTPLEIARLICTRIKDPECRGLQVSTQLMCWCQPRQHLVKKSICWCSQSHQQTTPHTWFLQVFQQCGQANPGSQSLDHGRSGSDDVCSLRNKQLQSLNEVKSKVENEKRKFPEEAPFSCKTTLFLSKTMLPHQSKWLNELQ